MASLWGGRFEKDMDYINNQENVDRERFKSIYEN